jgi:hypothetical protein
VPPISSSRFTAALRSELANNAAQLDRVEDLFTVDDLYTAMTGSRSRTPA